MACALLGATSASGLELTGTWHVLVHYTDAGSERPDQPRWEDEVWVFEPRDGRLRWTVYSIAVFEDETGRFERDPSGRYARVPHFWQPNAAQRTDIADGLRVNPRGASYSAPRDVLQVYIDEFDRAYDEGTMFLLTMHPHYIGHRSRIVILEGLIDHIRQKPGVWFATHRAAAEYAKQQSGMTD